MSSPEFLVVGRITKAHGLSGYVEVVSFTDNPDRFSIGNSFTLQPPPSGREKVTISAVRRKKDRFLLLFEDFAAREDIEILLGLELTIPASEAEKPEDAFWVHELVGCAVVTLDGATLGRVSEVMSTGSNDVYVVAGKKIYYIPAIEQIVTEIDLERRRIIIDPIPGLLEL